MSVSFRGIIAIPSTPFDEQLEVDWEGLRRIVDFCIECGAHGIVGPINASAFASLSDEERLKWAHLVVEQVAGRVPVIIGVQGVSTSHAVMFSRHAKEIGADAVIAMTPYVRKLQDEELILQYYRGISDASDLPIFVQNYPGADILSVKTEVRLLQEVEHVEYIKEEITPVTHHLTELIEMAGPKMKGVLGSGTGHNLLLTYPRGVTGEMPGCYITDVVVRLWDAMEAGDLKEAKRIWGLMAPLRVFIQQLRTHSVYTEILCRRGVIKCARQRGERPRVMDEYDDRVLDDFLRDLQPLFTWHSPGGAG